MCKYVEGRKAASHNTQHGSQAPEMELTRTRTRSRPNEWMNTEGKLTHNTKRETRNTKHRSREYVHAGGNSQTKTQAGNTEYGAAETVVHKKLVGKCWVV